MCDAAGVRQLGDLAGKALMNPASNCLTRSDGKIAGTNQ